MQITERDLQDNLITDFGYHDGTILKVTKDKKDVKILFRDGYDDKQINELNFINCKFNCQNDLEDCIIYQLDDLVSFGSGKWNMSFLVFVEGGLLEKVDIEADNIILKKYCIKENLLEAEGAFEEQLEEIKMIISKIVLKTIQNKKIQDLLLDKIFQIKKRKAILSDFNNYILVSEEDLNKETYDKN